MIRITREWNIIHSDKTLEYGDISRPGGVNTPDHHTHNIGMAWDMRLFRKDNALIGTKLNSATSDHAQFDRESTWNFIRLARSLYPETTVYFNDTKTIAEFKGLVEHRGGHWDHLHIMPFTKGRE